MAEVAVSPKPFGTILRGLGGLAVASHDTAEIRMSDRHLRSDPASPSAAWAEVVRFFLGRRTVSEISVFAVGGPSSIGESF
jgi:hypothetical protein